MQTISELHKAARSFAEAGIPVFPVEVNGKKPVTPNGFKDATTDIQQIDEWWTKNDYNLAFSPGEVGLFVLDFDPGSVTPQNLPSTYTVQTPRGGYHYYYEGDGPTSASKLGKHIDTRGNGGYVLLPPSTIDGKIYSVSRPLTYAKLPDWILEALKSTEAAAPVTEDLDLPINVGRAKDLLLKYVGEGNVAIEGQGGDDHTYRICCEILDFGLSPETALDLVNTIWNPHCLPVWDEEELAAKIQNAASYQQNEPGSKAIEPPEKVFGQIVANLFPVKQSRFYFKDETEQDNEPDPEWIIKDLISERSTVLLYAPTSSYKSFLALGISLAVATNKAAYGSEVISGPVFYCALEGKAHLKKARRAWKIANGVNDKIKNFFLGRAPLIGIPDEIQEFGDEIKKRCPKPKLIIIDTLSKAMAGLNENDALDAGKFIQFCDSLVETFGCTVIAIHHTGKDQTRGARGSSAFLAGFDTVLEVQANKKNKAVSVWVRKHKDAEEKETPWTFEGRAIGGSLAFFPTNSKEHFALTNEQSEFSPRKIGAALQILAAYGQEKAVSTNILARQITTLIESQTEEEHQVAISRIVRILNKAAKDFLEAYTVKNGKQTLWALPAPN